MHVGQTAKALVIPIRSIALMLFSVALVVGAQPAASEEKSAEEKLLGAPCRSPRRLSRQTMAATREINRKEDEAMKRGDSQTAIAMRKELIRNHCHGQYLWFYLAELYVELGQNGDAIAVLEYLHGKKKQRGGSAAADQRQRATSVNRVSGIPTLAARSKACRGPRADGPAQTGIPTETRGLARGTEAPGRLRRQGRLPVRVLHVR